MTKLDADTATSLYDVLAVNGFRRSHGWAYRPHCPGCVACVPVRVQVKRFVPSRNMRRVQRRNGHLRARWIAPEASEEQFTLFHRYVGARHGDGDMAGMSWDDYRAMIEDAPVRTGLVEWRDPGGALRAAMLVDRLQDGVSAVYSFFDPDDAPASPGTFMVLEGIAGCVQRELPYLYLGYWIQGSRKMAYKARFGPLEAFGASGWRAFDPT